MACQHGTLRFQRAGGCHNRSGWLHQCRHQQLWGTHTQQLQRHRRKLLLVAAAAVPPQHHPHDTDQPAADADTLKSPPAPQHDTAAAAAAAAVACQPRSSARSRHLAGVLAARARALVPAAVQRWVAEHDDPRLRGLVLLNCMTLLMGSNWVVVKESGADMDPWVFTALRFLLAAAAFAPFLAKGWRDPALRDAGLEIGAWSAAGYLTQSLALAHTPASRASLLSTFTVLAVPLLAGLSGAKIKPLVWGCGAAALLGTSLLESGGGAPPNIGDAYSVVSALFFAVQLFRTERISRQLPGGAGGMLPLMALSMATVAVVSAAGAGVAHAQEAAHALAGLQQAAVALAAAAAGALASGGGAAGAAATDAAAAAAGGMGGHPGHAVGELLYTSLCSTDLALLCEMVALQSVTSTEAAMVYSLEPVSGALLAYAFLGDRWGPAGWAGAALILAASLVTQLAGAEEVEQGSEGGQAPAGGQEVGSAAAEQQAE